MYSGIAFCFCLVVFTGSANAQSSYHGLRAGQLSTLQYEVSGTVFVVDAHRLQIVNFTYNGNGPAAVIWVGFRNDHSAEPSSRGEALPDPDNEKQAIRAYANETIIINIPDDKTTRDLNWISIWCVDFSVDFGNLVFVWSNLGDPPAPVKLGEFSRLAHQVRSGEVTLLDSRTFRIENLRYDGRGPAAWFLVGSGRTVRHMEDGSTPIVPDETGSTDLAREYRGETITIMLPRGYDVRGNELSWLSLYCIRFQQDFGNVRIPENINVPPYIDSGNCEKMTDDFQVAWSISNEDITFEFRGKIEDDQYMSFGLSGQDSHPTMDNGDVTVVHFLNDRPNAEDYDLNLRAQCSGGVGACPDRLVNGATDSITDVMGSRVNGITRVKFSRKLSTGDTVGDRVYSTSGNQFYIWAIGRMGDEVVTKHMSTIRAADRKQLNFGRTPEDNCPPLQGGVVDRPKVDPWDIPMLSGLDTTVFTIKIGPSGGDKGYTAITGQNAWGIAFYVNDLLIPELELKRNVTYTFRIQTGDDTSNLAEYHPFYITSDSRGGQKQRTPPERQNIDIYAGLDANGNPLPNAVGPLCEIQTNLNARETSYQTFQEFFNVLTQVPANCPNYGELQWTVPLDAPNLLYYHCWTHQYLGWKIRVVDEYGGVTTTRRPPTTTTTGPPGSSSGWPRHAPIFCQTLMHNQREKASQTLPFFFTYLCRTPKPEGYEHSFNNGRIVSDYARRFQAAIANRRPIFNTQP